MTAGMPVAQVRGAIAHAASQGCAAAILREVKAACSKRDEEAATNLMEGAAAEPFIGASFQAAFNRATSLGLGKPTFNVLNIALACTGIAMNAV